MRLFKSVADPDEEIGSGLYIFVYHLHDGSTVSIGTPYLTRIECRLYRSVRQNIISSRTKMKDFFANF
jgi:hypothetical protein